MDRYRGEHQRPEPRDRLSESWSPDLWQREKADPDFVPEPSGLSRRSLLTGGTALAALAVAAPDPFGMLSQPAKLSNDVVAGQFDHDPEVRRIQGHLKERYGIDLVIGPKRNQEKVLGNKPTLEKYRTTLRLVKEEMFKYPPDMIRKIGEGRGFEIPVIENLSTTYSIRGMSTQKNTPAAAQENRRVAALAPPLEDGKPAQLIVDPSHPEFFQRHTLHHDINHRCTEKWENPQERDRKWSALHKKVSQNPYNRVPPDTYADVPPKERHFLTQYASSSAVEDQAICAEWMMTPRLHAEFVRRRDNDPDPLVREILAAKYELTIADYSEWSDGEMGRPFWDGIYRRGMKENAAIGKTR